MDSLNVLRVILPLGIALAARTDVVWHDITINVEPYHADNRHKRKEAKHLRASGSDNLIKRDQAGLEVFWPRDVSLEDTANLLVPRRGRCRCGKDPKTNVNKFAIIGEDMGKS